MNHALTTTSISILSQEEINQLISKPDLVQDNHHAIGLLIKEIETSLAQKYNVLPKLIYGNSIVSLEDNYYALNYDKKEITLSSRYTKYVSDTHILRTQMTSVVPELLRQYNKVKNIQDELYICPGKVYRRDVRDKTHVGEPHQCDIWYITKKQQTRTDLLALVETIIGLIERLVQKKVQWRYVETVHNYTEDGIEVEMMHNGQWLEILECGLISQKVLNNHGITNLSGLALGLGLERLVMIVKNIADIRTLYSSDIRIKEQLTNLKKYKEVSKQPVLKRDLSLCVDNEAMLEEITEKIYAYLPDSLTDKIESLDVIKEYMYDQVPPIAQEKLGMKLGQKNVLMRIVLRDLTRSLTSEEGNDIYTAIYTLVHEGTKGYSI